MGDGDYLDGVTGRAVHDRKWKAPQQVATYASRVLRPAPGRGRNAFNGPVQLRQELLGSQVTALAVPGDRRGRLRNRVRVIGNLAVHD